MADELLTARASSTHDPPQLKERAWHAEKKLAEIHQSLSDTFAQAVHALTTTVIRDPQQIDARSTLCDLYLSHHEAARIRGDIQLSAYYRRMLASVDDGRFADVVANEGSLYIDVEPKSAQITLSR